MNLRDISTSFIKESQTKQVRQTKQHYLEVFSADKKNFEFLTVSCTPCDCEFFLIQISSIGSSVPKDFPIFLNQK